MVVVSGIMFSVSALGGASLDSEQKTLNLLYIKLRKPLRGGLSWWIS